MIELFVHSFGLRFHYQHKPGFDIFAFIDRAAATGFSGINVSAYGPKYFELSGGDADHIARVRKHLELRGLKIDIETNGTDAEHLGALMALAGQLGAGQIRTYTRRRGTPAGHSADRHEEGGARPAPTPAQRIAQAVADLREVGPLAERAGINILLENHEELAGTEVAAILSQVDHPHIRAVYDYGNSMVFLEEPMDALDVMAPWVGTAHLKDHVMLPEGADGIDRPNIMGVPVGQGNLPVVDITRRLVAAGLKRVCFENVWAYRTPLRVKRGRGVLGEGAFAYRQPPFQPWHILPDPQFLGRSNPSQLVALEDRAFNESVAWLAQNFASAGIALARPLRPI